jgi:multidrug efflux system outer membrane protein
MVQAENPLTVLSAGKPFAVTRGRSLDEQIMVPDVPVGLPAVRMVAVPPPDLLIAE